MIFFSIMKLVKSIKYLSCVCSFLIFLIRRALIIIGLQFILPLVLIAATTDSLNDKYFVIQVVDESTGRGVPLVELKTVNHLTYYTDNNGVVAFYEPGLMERDVFFFVNSHGYEFPKDGFGYAGKTLFTRSGTKAVLKIKRLNIAERLYRITGYGTYRDSVLVGLPIPIKEPLTNGLVFGQDTVISAIYNGKIYWFWGDTQKPSYPLGNFAVSGAVSDLPEKGGLEPDVGINLKYFIDKTGFSKQMCPIKADGMKWLEGLMVLTNESGEERLFARYAAVRDLRHINEFGLVEFNREKEVFERVVRFDTTDGYHISAHPFLVSYNGELYYYLFPALRVKADVNSIKKLDEYENFTCLIRRGTDGLTKNDIDRSKDGVVQYQWRKAIAPFRPNIHQELIRKGLIKPQESWIYLHNVEDGMPIKTANSFNGSVAFNEYLQRWIMIAMGQPGEIWFSVADTPTGQWVYARKIVSHNNYNFYNPAHHPFFDRQNGRIIYFEGTYTAAFSSAKVETPGFDYNQIMYRLDLSDPRTILPLPVYQVNISGSLKRLGMREVIEKENLWDSVESAPFCAIPPSRKLNGLLEIGYLKSDKKFRLYQKDKPGKDDDFITIFCALPVESEKITAEKDDKWQTLATLSRSANAILYEYIAPNGDYVYLCDGSEVAKNLKRSDKPLCRVWKNPVTALVLDYRAKPVIKK